MLTFEQLKYIKQVKDRNVFTQALTVNKYIQDVRNRLSLWYGVDATLITDLHVYDYLRNNPQ